MRALCLQVEITSFARVRQPWFDHRFLIRWDTNVLPNDGLQRGARANLLVCFYFLFLCEYCVKNQLFCVRKSIRRCKFPPSHNSPTGERSVALKLEQTKMVFISFISGNLYRQVPNWKFLLHNKHTQPLIMYNNNNTFLHTYYYRLADSHA